MFATDLWKVAYSILDIWYFSVLVVFSPVAFLHSDLLCL